MIKKIAVDQVRVGMYIAQLDREWMEHSFFSSRFAVKDAAMVSRLFSEGIRHVFIDTEKGRDIDPEPRAETLAPPPPVVETVPGKTPQESRVAYTEERSRAQAIYGEASVLVRNLMGDLRLGRQIDLDVVEPMTEKMIASVIRNPHALSSVARIKSKDEYTFMHSVGVATIMIAFARHLGLPEDDVREIARGALLHDVGKILVPSNVLNKPGPLTNEEFAVMRTHAQLGTDVLSDTRGFSSKAMEAVSMHHERNDGSGYPLGLKGGEISLVGQMSAVVDVYDALTSLRVYKEPWEPSVALKKMLEWSPSHFDTELVQRFIRFLGIYPVGSLVELESGLVGIVTEQTTDLLRPHLLVIYHADRRHYISPHYMALEHNRNDRIRRVTSAAQYGIDAANFI